MSTQQLAIKSVLQNQMELFAKELSAKYPINQDEANQLAKTMIEGIEINIPKRKRVDDGKPRFYKITGYNLFSKDYRLELVKAGGEGEKKIEFGKLSQLISDKWKSMTKEEKDAFNAKAATYPPVLVKSKQETNSDEPRYQTVSGYSLFNQDFRAKMLLNNPKATFGEISKSTSAGWHALSEDDKNVWKQKGKDCPPILIKSKKQKEDEKEQKTLTKKISGYMLFCKETRPSIVSENSKLTFEEIGARLSSKWQSYTDAEKGLWNDKAKDLPPVVIKARKNKKPAEAKKETKQNQKKPKSAYALYQDSHKENLKKEFLKSNPDASNADINKHVSESWKSLSKDVKSPYQVEAARLKEEFNKLHGITEKPKRTKKSKESTTEVVNNQVVVNEQEVNDAETDTDSDSDAEELTNKIDELDVNHNNSQDEPLEVDAVPVTINGTVYYLDQESNNLYNEEGDLVGTYKDGKISK